MTKRIAVALVVLSLLLTRPADATGTSFQRSDATTTWTTTGRSLYLPTGNCSNLTVRVKSAAGSSATVLIEQSDTSGDANPFVSATITNPSTAGEAWGLKPYDFTAVNVSVYASGTISATCTCYAGKDKLQ